MGQAKKAFAHIEGLEFYRLLGSGAGSGFRPWPDLGTYALLTVWKNGQLADQSHNNDEVFQSLQERSSAQRSFWLKPVRGHGTWHGKAPFDIQSEYDTPNQRTAVITRASIKPWLMPYFWLRVGGVSKHLVNMPGLQLAKGIGEWPLFEQATFSVWQSASAIDDYAYKTRPHKSAVRSTRKVQWYSEEMFTRFAVLEEQQGIPKAVS
jgi:heme-degrading monooxygenase HmoA